VRQVHVGKERDGVAAIHGVLDQWLFVASARRVKPQPALVAREQGGVGVMAAIQALGLLLGAGPLAVRLHAHVRLQLAHVALHQL